MKIGLAAVHTVVVLLGLFGGLEVSPATAKCLLQQAAELHVVMENHQALAPVDINGQRVLMIVDSGAASTILFPEAAHRLGLATHYLPGVIRFSGVGGQAQAQTTEIARFKLDQNYTLKDFTVAVAGQPSLASGKGVGLLGQDILSAWDVEVDLAHGLIRLLRPTGCKADELVYWGAAYAQAPIEPNVGLMNHTTVRVRLNGKSVDAFLDTGASGSVATLAAAAEAGVRPASPQVEKSGASHGLGGFSAATWTASFDTFGLGEESINHAKIRIADLYEHNTHEETGSRIGVREENLPGMLLGADFFLSHHVLIANSQHRVYFSYNGGPVFDTAQPARAAVAPTPTAATPDQQATKPPQGEGADGKGG